MSSVKQAPGQTGDGKQLHADVSAALPLGGGAHTVDATLYRPPGAPRAVLVCWPGGSYDRRYWAFNGAPGFNFATHMTAQGFAVVAADPLGVGRSSRPGEVDAVTLEVMAAACAEFVRQMRERLDLLSGVPLAGVGHSLGGCLVVMAQALHGCYDRVANLGFTHGAKDAVTSDTSGAGDARASAVEQAKAFFADWDAGYAIAPREPNHAWLYTPTTPDDVIAADDATVAPWPRQAYVEALLPGYSAGFASKVTCPVFLGFGDHDIPERPHDEVAFYTGSVDVTLAILRDAAHCHNFAVTRRTLWDRIGAWAVEPSLSGADDGR
jgi:pimeloyl-ACP methyl ester carboxylesterase